MNKKGLFFIVSFLATVTAHADTPPPKVTVSSPGHGLSITGQALTLGLSSSSTTGALSSTDWTTFNNKQSANSCLLISNNLSDVASITTSLNNLLPSQSTNNGKFLTTNGTNASWATVSGSGTVTSVGLSNTSDPIYTITGSPVTASGTINLGINTQSANRIFAGPLTGSPANPAFRLLVSADISPLFGNLTDTGTDGIVVTGGTGVVLGAGTSLAQHVADTTHSGYLSSTDWNTFNGKQASGNYITALTGDVTASGPGSVAATIAASAVTNAKLANMAAHTYKGNNTGSTAAPIDVTSTQLTADLNLFSSSLQGLTPNSGGGTTNFLRADGSWASPPGSFSNPMTTLGDIIYEDVTPTAVRLAGNTTSTKKFLTQTGTGTVSAAPVWNTIATGDVPTLNQNTTGSAGSISASNVITNSNLSQMAAHTYKGNNTGSTANAADITSTQLTADLNQFTSSLQGLVPSSGGGTTNFLRADGTWASAGGSSPLTTKGDLFGFSTVNARVPVGTDGQVLTADSAQTLGVKWSTISGTGTVTSVAMTVPSDLSVSGSPVTTSGTLAVTANTQNANLVKAGPTSGGAATPTYRALVNADIPTTLSGIRINPRVVTLTDASTVTLNSDTTDMGILTTLSQATLFANPTGTPVDDQHITIRIKSTTTRALTWDTQFRGSTDQALPTATTGSSKTDYFGFVWNAADSKWDSLAVNKGF